MPPRKVDMDTCEPCALKDCRVTGSKEAAPSYPALQALYILIQP